MARQQLPPQIKKIEVADRKAGKTVVRYEVKVDAGVNPETGRRQQVRRRYLTEAQARRALAEITDKVTTGTFVARKTVTVEQVCANYLAGRHNLRASSRSKLSYDLAPLRERHGLLPVQQLTKHRIDELVADLVAGGTQTAKGRTRRPWGATAVNKVTQLPKGHGLNAETLSYGDLVADGVIDPVKVTRSAVLNAASVARMVLTTETAIVDKPEEEVEHAGHHHGHAH